MSQSASLAGIFDLQSESILTDSIYPEHHLFAFVVVISVEQGVFQQLSGDEQKICRIFNSEVLEKIPDGLYGDINKRDIRAEF